MEVTIKLNLDDLLETIQNGTFLAMGEGLKNARKEKNEKIKEEALKMPETKETKSESTKPKPAEEEKAEAPESEVPTEKMAYSYDKLQAAASELVRNGKTDELCSILHEFGAQSMPNLKPDQYNAFAKRLREIGGLI